MDELIALEKETPFANRKKNHHRFRIETHHPGLRLGLALAPSIAQAGAIQSLHSTLVNTPASVTAHPTMVKPPSTTEADPKTALKTESKVESKLDSQTTKKPVTLGLNDKGDMAISRGDLSVTMAYNAPEDLLIPKERVLVAQAPKQETPSINGISLKVTLVF